MGFGLNILAILVATIVSMVTGFIWYGALFMKPWMKYTKVKTDKGPEPMQFVLEFLTQAVMATVLSLMIVTFSGSLANSLGLGLLFWLGFMVPMELSNTNWEKRPWGLFAINTAGALVIILVQSLILGLWM